MTGMKSITGTERDLQSYRVNREYEFQKLQVIVITRT